jgi:hypothetical protein
MRSSIGSASLARSPERREPGVTVTEVVPGSTYTFETRREAGRIVAITWKEERTSW